MISGDRQLREDLVATSRALHQMGWVANHDGNVTAKISTDRFLATPTSVSKADVEPGWLIVVNRKGERVAGDRKGFSELALHLAAYSVRSDVGAVLHAHPPYATAFAVAGRALERPIIAEAVVSLGASIPLAVFALPGTDEYTSSVRHLLSSYDAILLENHGVLTVGADLEQAYLRMELVEHLAKIEATASQLGGARYLERDQVLSLLEKRAKAGLGPRARGLPEPPLPLGDDASAVLRRIVEEEIRSALR